MQLYKYLPMPSDRMGTLWALTSIKDAFIIEYGPAGTTHYGIEGYDQLNTELRAAIYTTHMDENDIVMGDSTRLEETIREVDFIYKPRIIFVVASSISSIIGTDIENVCVQLQEDINAKLVCFTGGGFRGDYTLGIREVLTSLAKYAVRDSDQKRPQSFNIIGSNADCYNFLSDIKEIKIIMKECFGYSINAVFTANSSLDDIENASKACLNIVLRSEGLECAQILKDKYDIPYAEGAPYGLKGTLEWIQNIEKLMSIKAHEEYLSGQTEKAKKNLFRFRHSIMPYKKLKAIIAGNYDFTMDIVSFMKDELSLQVEKIFVNHSIKGASYRKMNDDTRDVTLINPTEDDRERIIIEIKPDVLLTDAVTLEIGSDTPIKLQVSNPNFSRVNIYEYTAFMGFNGMNYLIELLLNQISNHSSQLELRF